MVDKRIHVRLKSKKFASYATARFQVRVSHIKADQGLVRVEKYR